MDLEQKSEIVIEAPIITSPPKKVEDKKPTVKFEIEDSENEFIEPNEPIQEQAVEPAILEEVKVIDKEEQKTNTDAIEEPIAEVVETVQVAPTKP